MDEIDQKQQEEIIALQKKDMEHDTQLSVWSKISMVFFAVILAIFVAGIIGLPFIAMEKERVINIYLDKDLVKELRQAK
jgi:hypothetical protein